MVIDNEKSYDLICDEWHKFRSATVINKCIVEFADRLSPNGNVLDIGCGTGYPVANYMALRNFNVTGIDISRKMIDKAKTLRLKNAVFIKRDILDFTTDTLYDGVIAFDSIWHIEKNRQPEAYRKIAALMKSGAYFIFTAGNRNDETTGAMFNQKFYYGALGVDELTALFSEIDLKIISLTKNYKEPTTGERDLLITAQKI